MTALSTTTRAVGVALAISVLGGCTTEPAPAPSPSPVATSSPTPVVDPDREALTARVGELGATLDALRTELEAATAGDRGALEAAAALLVADVAAVTDPAPEAGAPDADDGDEQPADATTTGEGEVTDAPTGTTSTDTPPILPGPLTSRAESVTYGDLLTRMLAAARSAGGAGEPALRFLADPLAGDLGAWQRAPDDQLAAIARAGQAGDLAATEAAVLDLAGEAPRALAWVVHGLEVPGDAAEAAGRALAHLTVIDLALDQL